MYASVPDLRPLPSDYPIRYVHRQLADAGFTGAGMVHRVLHGQDPLASQARRRLTRLDPLLFGLIYFREHLTGEHTGLSLSPFHVFIAERVKTWARPSGYREDRFAVVSPRDAGKSTWTFLVAPMWAAAHQHRMFIGALADSPSQSTRHFRTFRMELDSNDLIRLDYPDLCRPLLRPDSGTTYADKQDEIQQASGFVMIARGIDSKQLGMKVGKRRPDLLLADDIEPQESQYSLDQMNNRLGALLETVLPLNDRAAVALSGTVTMPDSIVHQLVRPAYGGEAADWPAEAGFRCWYFPAVYDAPGGEQSLWPEKWPLEQLQKDRAAKGRVGREFAKNKMNQPVSDDGDYWDTDDIVYQDLGVYGRTVLTVDPAVTKTATSDFYGFAVVSRDARNSPGKVYVRHAEHGKLSPKEARDRILALCDMFPDVGLVYVETNQGGELWKEVFHGLPVRLRETFTNEPKHVRFARSLNDYQRARVFHTGRFGVLEGQMLSYPKVINDDCLDAATMGILYFLDGERRRRQARPQPRGSSYLPDQAVA